MTVESVVAKPGPFVAVLEPTKDKVLDDTNNVADKLRAYIAGFSEGARDVIEKFGFDTQIEQR